MNKIIQNIGLGTIMLVYSVISNSATLIVENGVLMGATGVDVNGVLYDVQFLDGTCIELYGGCDEISDAPFANAFDTGLAIAANTALLEQVLIDSPLGSFDSSPDLTNGCFVAENCTTFTLVENRGLLGLTYLVNRDLNNVDTATGAGPLNPASDTSIFSPDGANYAVWSQSAVVPIPGTVWLFGSGLLGLIGVAKRKA